MQFYFFNGVSRKKCTFSSRFCFERAECCPRVSRYSTATQKFHSISKLQVFLHPPWTHSVNRSTLAEDDENLKLFYTLMKFFNMNLSCENMNMKLFSAPCRSRDYIVRSELGSALRRRMKRQLPTARRQRNISIALTLMSIPTDWVQWNPPGQCCDKGHPRISSPTYPVISGKQKTRKKVKR